MGYKVNSVNVMVDELIHAVIMTNMSVVVAVAIMFL